MWTDLATSIGAVESTHNQMPGVQAHKTNAAQLDKFAAVFLT